MLTTSYKNAKSSRVLSDLGPLSKGINYTDQEIMEGFAKLLVNYNPTKNGAALTPREGFNTKDNTDILIESAATATSIDKTHYAGQLYLEEQTNTDLYLADVMLSFGKGTGNLLKVDKNNSVNKSEAEAQRLDLAVWANVKLVEVED